jgi:ankyrin repeat protein
VSYISLSNKDDDTPIMRAIRKKQRLLSHFFFNKRLNFSLKNSKKETPYSLALENNYLFF